MASPALGFVQATPPPPGVGPQQVISGTSRQISSTIAAGAVLAFPGLGSEFYFDFLSASVLARPYVNGTPGAANSYTQGTGLNIDPLQIGSVYNVVELTNPNSFPVVFSLRLGFTGFIDRRLVQQTTQANPVTYATYGAPNTLASVAVPDLTNSTFADLNGGLWIATSRIAIRISNLSLSPLPIYNSAGTLVVDEVMSSSSYYLPSSGNFLVKVAAGNINGTISELYNAILPGS